MLFLCPLAHAQTPSTPLVETESPIFIALRIAGPLILSILVLWLLRYKKVRVISKIIHEEPELARTNPMIWFVSALILYIGVSVAGGTIAKAVSGDSEDPMVNGFAMAVGMYPLAVIICIVTILTLSRLFPGPRFSFRWQSLTVGLLAFVISMPILFLSGQIASLLQSLLVGEMPDQIAHPTLTLLLSASDDWRVWAIMAGAVIGAPVLEETVYRGFLQTSVLRATGQKWIAIWLASGLFALAHLGTVPWHAMVPIFVLGLICGMVYEHRGVWAAIVVHGSFNATQIALAFLLAH